MRADVRWALAAYSTGQIPPPPFDKSEILRYNKCLQVLKVSAD